MTVQALVDEFDNFTISNPDCLQFDPTEDIGLPPEKFEDIPRYLFRVFTPQSAGRTDEFWAISRAVRLERRCSKVDIFDKEDSSVANMLNKHLRWWAHDEANLVSWTSSLLFALQYVFYLRASEQDGSTFDEIKLCVIDTTCFPKRAFLRDMDLIEKYRSLDNGLDSLGNLRSGSYYFGEYLSQGALKIEGRCNIVSAQAIIDNGLFEITPQLQPSQGRGPAQKNPLWAKKVIELREDFNHEMHPVQTGLSYGERQAVIDIAMLFEPRWRLPVAANFLALRPRQVGDAAIPELFNEAPFTIGDRMSCSPWRTKVFPYTTLPEVQQVATIMWQVFKGIPLTVLGTVKESLAEFESGLRAANLPPPPLNTGMTGPQSPITDQSHRTLLHALEALIPLCFEVHKQVQAGQGKKVE